MYEGSVWASHCHCKKPPTTWFPLIPMVFLFAMIFSLAFWGFGPAAIVFLVLLVVGLVATIVMGIRFKWYNPQLVFELTGECLMSYSELRPYTYFYIEYTDIKDFEYKQYDDGFCTVKVNFKKRTNAGTWARNIASIELVRIENFDTFKSVMNEHGVEGRPKTKKN